MAGDRQHRHQSWIPIRACPLLGSRNPSGASLRWGETPRRSPFHPTAKSSLVVSGLSGLVVWDVKNRKEVCKFERGNRSQGGLLTAAFLPGSDQVLTNWPDGMLRLWDARTGKLVRDLGWKDAIHVAVAATGRRLLAVSWKEMVVWDLDTDKQVKIPGQPKSPYSHAALAPDGRTLLSVSRDIILWDAQTGQEIRHLRDPQVSQAARVVFSRDGSKAYTGGHGRFDHSILEWDVAKGTLIRRLGSHFGWISGLAVARNGCWLYSTGGDGVVRRWDLETGTDASALKGHKGPVTSVSFAPDGRALLSGGCRPEDTPARPAGRSTGAKLPRGRAQGDLQQRLPLHFRRGRKECFVRRRIRRHIVLHALGYRAVEGDSRDPRRPRMDHVPVLSPDGMNALTVDDHGMGFLRDTHTGLIRHHFPKQEGIPPVPDDRRERMVSMAFAPDGRRAVSASNLTSRPEAGRAPPRDGFVRIWSLEDGKVLSSWPVERFTGDVGIGSRPRCHAAYSPDLQHPRIAWVNQSLGRPGAVVFIADVVDGKIKTPTEHTGHDGFSVWLEFSPDGQPGHLRAGRPSHRPESSIRRDRSKLAVPRPRPGGRVFRRRPPCRHRQFQRHRLHPAPESLTRLTLPTVAR